MNIIWNKQELGKIKKIILNRTNLKLDEENMLVTTDKVNTFENIGTIGGSIYNEITNEIEKLFYYQDRLEIERILTKAKEVQADPKNKLHFGLIMCLSKTNPIDHTYIFEIFKEIASQYDKVIYSVANLSIEFCNNSEEISSLINSIINSKEETFEEILIKEKLITIFKLTNGITEENIFTPLITKCNSLIKERLIYFLNKELAYKVQNELINKYADVYQHNNDFCRKIQHQNINHIKNSKAKLFSNR